MQLRDIQQQLTQLLFADPIKSGECPAEFTAVFSKNAVPLDRQLHVYQNHIRVSLRDVIVSHFHLIEILAGKTFIEQAAQNFVLSHPPKEACLDRYGADFPDFLASAEQIEGFPFLADAARLDWLMTQSRNAHNDNTLSLDAITQIDPQRYADVTLQLKDSVKLFHSNYPLDKIYRFAMDAGLASKTGRPASAQAAWPDDTNLTKQAETWLLVKRVNWEAHVFTLNQADYTLLTLIKEQSTLGSALEKVLAQQPDFDFSQFWANYFELGLFTHLEVC